MENKEQLRIDWKINTKTRSHAQYLLIAKSSHKDTICLYHYHNCNT